MARAPKTPSTAAESVSKQTPVSPRKRARELSELALKTLEKILTSEGGDAGKIAAAREVLDRAYGKTKADEKAPASKTLTVVIRRFGEDANVIPLRKR